MVKNKEKTKEKSGRAREKKKSLKFFLVGIGSNLDGIKMH